MRTKGWTKVLRFTYVQMVKSKSFITSSVIMVTILAIMIAGLNFIPKIIMEKDDKKTIEITDSEGNVIETEAFKIEKLYIYDGSGFDLNLSTLFDVYELKCSNIKSDEVEAIVTTIESSEEAVALVSINKTDGESTGLDAYEIKISRPRSTDLIKDSDCYALTPIIEQAIKNNNLISLGVSPEDLAKTNAVITSVVNVGNDEPKSEMAQVVTSVLTMSTSLILFILIMGYGQLTAQSVAAEKTSRVMEFLLTSIKPLAVIIGKVLATTLVALTNVVVIGGVSAALFFIMAPYGILGEIVGMVETSDPSLTLLSNELGNAFSGITLTNIILIILIFILGFLFYALISGLIGASVSRIEDLQTALQPLVWISMLGFYLTYFSSIAGLESETDGNFVVTLSRYLPISSPFALPSAILSGQMKTFEIAISILVLALCLILFALFVSKVYEHIILRNGDRVKIKDMIKIAKNKERA